MMNRKQSSTIQLVRYVALGAVVGGVVLSLNYSKVSATPSQEEKTAVGQPIVVEVPKQAPIQKNGSDINVAIDTATPSAKNTSPKTSNKPAPVPQPDADPAPVQQVAPVVTIRGSAEPGPVILLNDRLISQAEMSSLPPDDIESVNVFKGAIITDEVIAQYGEDARNGIVAIYTKPWLAASNNKKRFGGIITTAVAGKATTVTAGQGQVTSVRNTATGAVFVATNSYSGGSATATSGSVSASSSVSTGSSTGGSGSTKTGTIVVLGHPTKGTVEKVSTGGKNEEIIVIGRPAEKGTVEKKVTTHEE